MCAVTVDLVPASPAVTEADTPHPEAGELLVKVTVASLNGIDVATAAGYLQGMMEHRFPLASARTSRAPSRRSVRAWRASRSATRCSVS